MTGGVGGVGYGGGSTPPEIWTVGVYPPYPPVYTPLDAENFPNKNIFGKWLGGINLRILDGIL